MHRKLWQGHKFPIPAAILQPVTAPAAAGDDAWKEKLQREGGKITCLVLHHFPGL